MNWLLVAQLLTVHLLGDFVLQPSSWVKSRTEKHFGSLYLYLHGLIHFILALILVFREAWWIALVIGLGHILFDAFKSYFRNNLTAFIIDQLLHALVIIICAGISANTNWNWEISSLIHNETFWWAGFGYLLVIFAYPKMVALATQTWRKDIPKEREVLYKAGRWIGIIERILILTFVFINQFAAIGFLLAAKSIFRFGDLREGKDKGHTEYVLIGTLLSFGITIITGLFIHWMINS